MSDVTWINNNELSVLKTTYDEEVEKYQNESVTLKFKGGNMVFSAAEKDN